MKRLLIINDRSKIIKFKNREVRTPVILEITDKDIPQLKLTLSMADIKHYEIKNITKKTSVEDYDALIENEEVIIEELDIDDDSEPKTILEKLMSGD